MGDGSKRLKNGPKVAIKSLVSQGPYMQDELNELQIRAGQCRSMQSRMYRGGKLRKQSSLTASKVHVSTADASLESDGRGSNNIPTLVNLIANTVSVPH